MNNRGDRIKEDDRLQIWRNEDRLIALNKIWPKGRNGRGLEARREDKKGRRRKRERIEGREKKKGNKIEE